MRGVERIPWLYDAICAHDAERARQAMNEHLLQASAYQEQENPRR